MQKFATASALLLPSAMVLHCQMAMFNHYIKDNIMGLINERQIKQAKVVLASTLFFTHLQRKVCQYFGLITLSLHCADDYDQKMNRQTHMISCIL